MLNKSKNSNRHFVTHSFNSLNYIVITFFLFTTIAFSTGIPKYVNLYQPNGYTFTAFGEGDEFLQRFKTVDNFTIVCPSDNWWYYAYQGTDGKLYPTQYRVGIEDDNAEATLTENINFSQSVIDAANAQRTLFNSSLTVQSVGSVSIGIILVDFPDRIAARTDPSDPNNVFKISHSPLNETWSKRYTMNNFQQLFFSTNTYNTFSPDNYPVYGSVNDYYKQTSYNLVSVSGAILNPADTNGKPNWYRADNSIGSYNPTSLRTEVINKAIAAGFNPSNYNKICIIHAGPWGGSAANLWPQTIFPYRNTTWIMGERNSAWDGDYGFASIGVHVHEMAHTLGLPDLYPQAQPFELTCGIGGYGLMGYGNLGAKIDKHSKPVLMNAWEKSKLGYLTPQLVTINQMNKQIPNIEQNSFAMKIVLYEGYGDAEYLLIENKQPIGFDSDIPIGGLLISHYVSYGSWIQPGRPLLDIEEVGGMPFTGCGSERNLYPLDFYHRPVECNSAIPNSQVESGDFLNITNQVFSPWSYPNSNRAGGSLSSEFALVFKSIGSTSVVDVYKTNAVSAPPSKPPLGFFHAGDGPIQYGWAYLAWGADYFYNPLLFRIEPDYVLSELQRKIGDYGTWQTVYSGSNRWWSDNSIIYDPQNGNIPVYFRVRVRDSQNLWSLWSDLYDTRTFNHMNATEKINVFNPLNILVSEYSLSTNYPNPFNPRTIINYAVKDAGLVSLKVFDILGSEVATLVNETKESGYYSVEFNASEFPSGVYIYTLQAGDFISSKKMILMK